MAKYMEKDAHSPALHVAQEESPPAVVRLLLLRVATGWESGQCLCAHFIQTYWYVYIMSYAL